MRASVRYAVRRLSGQHADNDNANDNERCALSRLLQLIDA